MDDFVVNVRQIGQYPQAAVGPNDLVLLQQGGLGGPYVSAGAQAFVQGALSGGAPLITNGQIFAANFVLPGDGVLSWIDRGSLAFSPGAGFTFGYTTDQFSSSLLHLRPDGSAQLPFNTLKVARDPFEPFEVATANFVTNNTVASFNGRIGAVCLTADDVSCALELQAGDQVATQGWVNALLCTSIPDFIYRNPFVFTWNGRVGDVQLTLADVEAAFFAKPGTYPTAPSPPLGDASNKIATTQFVDDSLEDWAAVINTSWNQADFELLNIIQTQYAPINSPVLTGTPSAPTAAQGTMTGQIATTAFVMAAVQASTTGVVSWNGHTGVVVMTATDIVDAQGALINSPAFTGTPTVPLPGPSDNSNRIASTAWVLQEIAAISAGVTSFNGRSGIVFFQASDITDVGGALLASPALSGTPTAPTAIAGTNTTQIATTAFVMANIGVASFNGRTGAVTLNSNDISAAGGAPSASPALTGTPTAPTAAPGTSTTQIATTAFVMNQLAGANVVSSFNGRTGAVTLQGADITALGNITIGGMATIQPAAGNAALININKSASGLVAGLFGQTNLSNRWRLALGNATAESGSNAGSDFDITRYSDAGALLDVPLSIARANGYVTVTSGLISTGLLQQNYANPLIVQNKTASGQSSTHRGTLNGLARWDLRLGDATAETGSNAGSSFALARYNDAGAVIDTPLVIDRAAGNANFSGNVGVAQQVISYHADGLVNSVSGGNARCLLTVAGARTWSVGTLTNAYFAIGDETGAETAFQILPGGQSATFTQNMSVGGGGFQPGGGPWYNSSDARIKTVSGNYVSGLAQIEQLNPITYNYRGNDTMQAPEEGKSVPYSTSPHYQAAVDQRDFIGLVAQEVETVMPELVGYMTGYIDGEEVQDLRGMDTGPLLFALINAVKELSAHLHALEDGTTPQAWSRAVPWRRKGVLPRQAVIANPTGS